MADPRRDLTAAYGLLDEETQGGMPITAAIKYGQLFLQGPHGGLVIPQARLIDDIVSIGFPPTDRRIAIWHDYGLVLGIRDIVQEVDKMISAGIPSCFLSASRRGVGGWFSSGAMSLMGRVRLVGDRLITAEDVESVAAWALFDLVMGQKYREVRDCDLCGVPFLSTGYSRYCRRRSPSSTVEHLGQSCLDVAKVRDHRRRRRG